MRVTEDRRRNGHVLVWDQVDIHIDEKKTKSKNLFDCTIFDVPTILVTECKCIYKLSVKWRWMIFYVCLRSIDCAYKACVWSTCTIGSSISIAICHLYRVWGHWNPHARFFQSFEIACVQFMLFQTKHSAFLKGSVVIIIVFIGAVACRFHLCVHILQMHFR